MPIKYINSKLQCLVTNSTSHTIFCKDRRIIWFCLFWEGSIFFFPSKLKMPFLLGYNNLSTKAPGVLSFHYQASTAGPCTWRYEIHPTFILQCAQWSTSPYNIFWSLSLMRKPPNFYHCMCPRTLIIFSPAIIFQSVNQFSFGTPCEVVSYCYLSCFSLQLNFYVWIP